MHEPKEQSYLIMDTLVKTCRYRQVFTVLDSTLIKAFDKSFADKQTLFGLYMAFLPQL